MNFLDKPTTDFGAVRDGRRSMPLWLDVDLSSARSIAAGNALSINIAGNSFYVDADTVNVGIATLHFQDTNLGNSSAPFVAAPGFVANVAFTQILVENTAQAGKRLRIFYGVDIDFRAGVNASVISGSVSIAGAAQVANKYAAYTGAYKSATALAANTPEAVFLPAANVNGAIVSRMQANCNTGATYSNIAYIAKNAAPANVLDGDVLAQEDSYFSTGTPNVMLKSESEIFVPAGKGLYFISSVGEVNVRRSVLYRLL